VLGPDVVARETIHEPPLSLVRRVLPADGRTVANKSQLPPTVEPEFYSRAASPPLPGHRVVDPIGESSTTVFDWIDAILRPGSATIATNAAAPLSPLAKTQGIRARHPGRVAPCPS
jgi:hypothetical protein